VSLTGNLGKIASAKVAGCFKQSIRSKVSGLKVRKH